MKEIASVFNKYKADTFRWPTANDSTTIKTGKHTFASYPGLYRNTINNDGWEGPYLNRGVLVSGKMVVNTKTKGEYTGLVDPWDRQYWVFTYASGYSGMAGALMLVCTGLDGKLSTSAANVFAGNASGDDIVQQITYSLK